MKRLHGLIGLVGIFAFLFLAPLTASAQMGGCEYDSQCPAGTCQVGRCNINPPFYVGTCSTTAAYSGAACSADGDPTTIEKCNGGSGVGACDPFCDDPDLDGYCDEFESGAEGEDICPGADDDLGCAGGGGPQAVEINSYNLPVDGENTYSFSVAEGTLVSAYLEAFYGNAKLETRWVQGGAVICTRYVGAGQTWGCDGGEMFVPTGTSTVYVTVTGTGPDTTNYTLTVDYTTPAGGWICRDDDYDGICNADDQCPTWSDFVDSDGDGTSDCLDDCDNNPSRTEYGICGCAAPIEDDTTDSDGDGVVDCFDICPGFDDNDDLDNDGTPDGCDGCPDDSAKVDPGFCGCGATEDDTDGDGTPNCVDECPMDYYKIEPGVCGCGELDRDWDGDGVLDCFEVCWQDPNKTDPGVCGCGEVEDLTDADADGIADCIDPCVGTEEYCACQASSTWLDETNGRMWQKEFHDLTNFAAGVYCGDLVLDGYDDWRPPTIDDLRTLIVGCAATEPSGPCNITEITDPDCLDGNDSTCTDSCYTPWAFPPLPPLCGYNPDLYMPECLAVDMRDGGLGANLLRSSSEDLANPDFFWGVDFASGELGIYSGTSIIQTRCVRDDACTDTDGDGVCDADDVCPGGDDSIDNYGAGEQQVAGTSLPNGTPDYCDCLTFDAVGTTLYPTPPETWSAANFETDSRVTFGEQYMWEDDTLACYEALKNPAFLFYFPRCDHNGNGLVDLQELFDIYHFAMALGGSTDCSAFQ